MDASDATLYWKLKVRNSVTSHIILPYYTEAGLSSGGVTAEAKLEFTFQICQGECKMVHCRPKYSYINI
jgi:hypothetical protein